MLEANDQSAFVTAASAYLAHGEKIEAVAEGTISMTNRDLFAPHSHLYGALLNLAEKYPQVSAIAFRGCIFSIPKTPTEPMIILKECKILKIDT